MQIRYQLSTIKKGNLSVSEYFQKVKHLADTLLFTNLFRTVRQSLIYSVA